MKSYISTRLNLIEEFTQAVAMQTEDNSVMEAMDQCYNAAREIKAELEAQE